MTDRPSPPSLPSLHPHAPVPTAPSVDPLAEVAPQGGAAAFSPWLWALPALGLALSAPLWLHWWEPAMFVAINQACVALPAVVWTMLSLLGNGWALLGVTSPLLLCAPRLLWAWLCAAPFAIVLARGGKALLESPRPAALIDNAQMRIVGETLHNVSMPSGHTLTAFAVASALYFALPRGQRMRHAWLWLLAAGAGLSRIAVGAHWPGDVAVGASLGLLCGLLAQGLLRRVPPVWLQATHTSARIVAVLLAVALYHLCTEAQDFAENQPAQWVLAAVVLAVLVVFVRRTLVGVFQRKVG
jgi:membrane-associated phospholipid phosphatase